MKQNLKTSLEFTFASEGLFSYRRDDAGNWTGGKIGNGQLVGSKYGISAPLLSASLGRPATLFDMRSLTKEQAEDIAVYKFWNVMFCYDLPAGIDLMVFDHGFNCGCRKSVRLLQKIVGTPEDGLIGPKTLKALNELQVEQLKNLMPVSVIEQIQKALEIPCTWDFDDRTISEIKKHNLKHHVICCVLAVLQDKSYRKKSGSGTYGNGWSRRVKGRLAKALEILKAAPVAEK